MRIKIIKAKPPEIHKQRVAAYARVSTDSPDQEGSLESQTQYYSEYLSQNPAYEFVGIYSDKGITGYKEQRPGFQQMMHDAMNGSIDLIYVKSISRFARNTEVLLKAVRALESKGVGVFFEVQNINTLSGDGELMMTILAAFAQGESDNYAELTRMHFKRLFSQGKPTRCTAATFGYSEDEYGGLIVNESEARVVRKIYELALRGATLSGIANWMNNNKIPAIKGGLWNPTGIRRILQNVTYQGDLMLQKSYLDTTRHRHPNKGQVESWYVQDNHPAIISRDDWQKVQTILDNHVIPSAQPVAYAKKDEFGNYLLAGKLFCPLCGASLQHKFSNSRTSEFWACRTNLKKTKAACPGIYVPAQVAEEWVITEPTTVLESKDDFGILHFTPVPKRNYERRVGCPYTKKET